jgi:hypothetical protein
MPHFTVEHGRKTYQCEQIITGAQSLKQTIIVNTLGSRIDPEKYGRMGKPLSSMLLARRAIAIEIILELGSQDGVVGSGDPQSS